MDEILGNLSNTVYHIYKDGNVYQVTLPSSGHLQLLGRDGYSYFFSINNIDDSDIDKHSSKEVFIAGIYHSTLPKNESGSLIFQIICGRACYKIINKKIYEIDTNPANYEEFLYKNKKDKKSVQAAILNYISKRYDEFHQKPFLIYEIVTALKFNYRTILNQIDRFIRDGVLDCNYNMHPLDTLPKEEQIRHRVTKGPKFDTQLNRLDKFRNITTQNDSGKNSEPDNYKYDIALSFAGENRNIAEELANGLKDEDVRVFYDDYEKEDLWGKDLYQHFQKVYRDRARYCIIFVSVAYAEKIWTRHELKQAQARAFRENQEYILPVRLDDTEIPGLNETIGYIDLRNHTIEELKEITLKKLANE
ncbi:MAG: TIR domain-containing protein [candidate division Zixibacteria bacterium]|nr:TIR domain-containing protein [candidate division Zixibacteria bacterium]